MYCGEFQQFALYKFIALCYNEANTYRKRSRP